MAPPNAPSISVIICTRDRAQWLARCLASLLKLEYEAFEVIVVDNASRDAATQQAVAATPFRYVREDRPGLDWARNRGYAEARHEVVAYIDDDAVADPGWLRGVALAFADPGVSAMTGLVRPAELETEAQRLFEQYGGMGKGHQGRVFQRAAMSAAELLAAHACGVGANMAFRRAVLAQLGGFDTALDVGTPSNGGGDIDMFHRVLLAGHTLRYEPAAIIAHYHRRDHAGLRRQLYNNGRAYGVYLLKALRAAHLPRREVLGYTLRWMSGWVLARLVQKATGRLNFPFDLVWAEAWGMTHAPWAYVATQRHDARLRLAHSSQ